MTLEEIRETNIPILQVKTLKLEKVSLDKLHELQLQELEETPLQEVRIHSDHSRWSLTVTLFLVTTMLVYLLATHRRKIASLAKRVVCSTPEEDTRVAVNATQVVPPSSSF